MGVDARLFINSSWGVDDIKDLIKTLPEASEVKIITTHTQDYSIISFKYNDEQRELGYFTGSRFSGFVGTQLSFRAWGASKEILTTIGRRIGGWFSPEDCNDDNWERFDNPGEGNLLFMVRQAVLEGKCDGQSFEEFATYHNQKTAEWKKHQEESHARLFGNRKK